jgi:hypothetical protein
MFKDKTLVLSVLVLSCAFMFSSCKEDLKSNNTNSIVTEITTNNTKHIVVDNNKQ